MSDFRRELQTLINRHCMENGSDTPDFLLAEYLSEQLSVFDRHVKAREKWYGRTVGGGAAIIQQIEPLRP